MIMKKSDKASSNKPMRVRRAVSSVNIVRTQEQRIVPKRISEVEDSSSSDSRVSKNKDTNEISKSDVHRLAKSSRSVSSRSVSSGFSARAARVARVARNDSSRKNFKEIENNSKSKLKNSRSISSKNSANSSSLRVTNSSKGHGAFVDARRLLGFDFIKKTLSETAGPLGIVERPKIIDFAARLKEKKNAYLHITIKKLLYVLIAVVAVLSIIWVLLFSPIFRLKAENIEISGSNEWVSKKKIADIASSQVDKSLFLVSSQEVINQLNDIPGVTEANVTKNFPQGLRITVRAQKPAAMLKANGSNNLTAVDSQGRVLNTVAGASIQGIPVIEVQEVGRNITDKAVLEAVKIVSSLSSQLRSRVTKVTAKTQDSIETTLGAENHIIVWGDSSELELKKAIVDKIINDPTKIGDKQRLDVSAPARPILK
ncbi:cell division protein FtsQ/DivIB [Gardnerella sp. 2492-Sm]|uniref:cell division protein FtsQ/DivIB n=1 Tax=unclassified Gardnerella TaxID=2628112 RepID=UPI003D094FCB